MVLLYGLSIFIVLNSFLPAHEIGLYLGQAVRFALDTAKNIVFGFLAGLDIWGKAWFALDTFVLAPLLEILGILVIPCAFGGFLWFCCFQPWLIEEERRAVNSRAYSAGN